MARTNAARLSGATFILSDSYSDFLNSFKFDSPSPRSKNGPFQAIPRWVELCDPISRH